MHTPPLDQDLGLLQRVEDLPVQQFIAQLTAAFFCASAIFLIGVACNRYVRWQKSVKRSQCAKPRESETDFATKPPGQKDRRDPLRVS